MLVIPQCLECIRYKDNNKPRVYICDAFPEGIPDKILFNKHDYKKTYLGDNGIRFEPAQMTNNSFDSTTF